MIFNACHKAATVKNNNGNLALHLAVGFNASNDVIRMKFGAYPESTVVQGCNGNSPLQFALEKEASNDVIKMICM